MKTLRKLAATAVAAGLVALSAPASAVLTLQFFDGANTFLGSVDQNSAFGDAITDPNNPTIGFSGTKFINGWRLQSLFGGYSQLDPLKLFLNGNIMRSWDVNQIGKVTNNMGSSGFIQTNNVDAQTLKIRLVETNFPNLPVGPSVIHLNDNFSLTSNPIQTGGNPQLVAVEIAAGTTSDGLAAFPVNSAAANPATLYSGLQTLCGDATGVQCGNGPVNAQGFTVPYNFTLSSNPSEYAPFVTDAAMAAYTGSTKIFGQVGDVNSGAILIAGFDIFTANSLQSITAEGIGFTNTITLRALPEPGTLALLGATLLGMAGLRRRKQQA
jgi:PEP-CTERM motif